MIVKKIKYGRKFIKEFTKLPSEIKVLAIGKEDIFKKNPLHSSLRLHSLAGKMKGYWSISVTRNYRIILNRQKNGEIYFVSIGTHDVYKSL
ncbi:type II toxin-antitoxin system mRNA interferase toxin, RelE/StbE family [Candidatus Falkowbacteria bacterium]|jgi:addiction module RelE/StbE family toxin|nr:type II toxin-antitoxin system mRNA interferase toxin, RelE/StbE family [Candidatus Falkowbacteria bacterium]MBT7007799.1 type II toxin-antitoxin system mRNA interferase toxin, RelE/StbE family [Candidatus Falkowbacteria bacterium]